MFVASCALALCSVALPQPDAPPAPAEASRPTVAVYSTRGDNRIHFLAAETLAPLGSHEVQAGAHELAISGDGRWVMGSAYGGPGKGHQPADKRLLVFDATAGKLVRVIDLGELQRPNDIVFLPGSDEALVTVEMPPRLLRVKASTGEFQAIDVEHKAGHMLTLAPDAKRAFVSHVAPGSVSVIDLGTAKLVANHKLPLGAEGIAVTPDGAQLWVGCNRSNAMVVFDVAQAKVTRSIECTGFPLRVRVAPDGATVAASCPMSREVVLFAAKDAKAEPVRIEVHASDDRQAVPTSLSFTPDGKALIVVLASEAGGELLRIDVTKREVTHRAASAGPIADALAVGVVALAAPSATDGAKK